MQIVITICSKEKDPTVRNIPAHQRYKSQRIAKVYSIAKKKDLDFFILSGKYGLIPANEIIPYYDYLLGEREVDNLVLLIDQQNEALHITSIEFYAKPRKADWVPYYQVLERFAIKNNIALNVMELD